jgi:hypothetical protein
MKKAVVGLCVSGAIGLWSAMKRASIRVFLDKNLETFLRNATLYDLSFFFPLGDLPRLSCVARQTAFCAVLMTAKVGSRRAKLWRPGILIHKCFLAMNHRKI